MIDEKGGISVKDVCRWFCEECDDVGPRITEENALEILAKLNKERKAAGADMIPIERKPADKTNSEWICAIHSVIKHRKHSNITIKVDRHVNVSEQIIARILAERSQAEQSNTS